MKLLYGGYGHNPSTTGKMYAYWGGDNYNVGQNVVAPVTNWKSGKNYNTMFTILSTYNPNSIPGQYEQGKLNKAGFNVLNGINIPGGKELKTIGSKDVMTLPGASQYSTKSQWTRASNQQAKARLMALNVAKDNTQAIARLSRY